MRLIDADFLIKEIKNNDNLPWNLDKISQTAFISCLEHTRTAYERLEDFEMSMISNLVDSLRHYQNVPEIGYSEVFGINEICKDAADTIEELSAKLQVANMESSLAYYGGGWIACEDRLPEEHDSMFAKLKGTAKWNEAMFEKISEDVNVTVEYENGKRKTMTLHTVDGKWKTDRIVKFKVIAWQPLPEPYHL